MFGLTSNCENNHFNIPKFQCEQISFTRIVDAALSVKNFSENPEPNILNSYAVISADDWLFVPNLFFSFDSISTIHFEKSRFFRFRELHLQILQSRTFLIKWRKH